MEPLLHQVARAHRRLMLEQFLGRLGRCLFVALAAAAIVIAVPRIVAIDNLPARWDAVWLGGAVLLALLTAGAWAWLRRRTLLDAAMEIDRRYDLRARVASSLSLPEADRDTEIGRALVEDAVREVDRIDIGERFRVQLGRRAWAPLVPALVAIVLMTVVAPREARSGSQAGSTEITKAEVKKSVEQLRKRIAERREQAEKKRLKDATGLLKQVEEGARELEKNDAADRKKALVELNDLAKELDKRRKQLGGKSALEQELNNLKDLGKGPAEKAADAIRKGDLAKAIAEFQKMQKDLAEGKLTKELQQKLAEQLGKMQKRLQQAEQARQQAMEELKRQIEEQRQQGNAAQANKLQQKFDQLQQNQQQQQGLQKLAQQMAQAQQAAQQGDQQQAADALQQMAEQLQQMQNEAAEMEMLADAMEMIEAAKQGLAGGDQMQPGDQMGPMPGMGEGEGEGPPGFGMGKGRGAGPRPDEENATSMRDTRVRQNPGKGASVVTGQVEGPNIKGQVGEAIKQEIASQGAEESDPLAEERLPRSRREHAQEFFKKLREEL